MSKHDRAEVANRFIEVIASHGRGFFGAAGRISRFEVDQRNRVWFVYSYSQKRIYVADDNGPWRGFTNGGTMRALVRALRDYIRTGTTPRLSLGPWPQWVCDGDLWGYGDDMAAVRDAAKRLGLM